jgi:hypothetical protein
MLMAHIAIQSFNLTDEIITICFEQDWFQDEISELRQLLLNKIPNHEVKEIIHGADRENIRFKWQNTVFIMNFDYYSQSCWLNAQDEIGTSKIQPLFKLMTKN